MVESGMAPGDLERVRGLARSALASLEAHRRRIDDLNVYPVPDGDTGTNLTLTVRAVVEELDASTAETRRDLAREVSRAALLAARGNSGVILSQIVRGAADVLGETQHVDDEILARALRAASDAAYRAVHDPVEGTMLSAIRALAEEAERRPADMWPALVSAGEAAVARTREQLDVLRDAGVVDAGAAGLLEIVRGLGAAVTGSELAPLPAGLEEVSRESLHQELSRYRYCTALVLEGNGLDREEIEAQVERQGDSLLVVGDSSTLKIHVHTDDPGAVLSLATAVGGISRVEIADMHEQTAARERRVLETVAEAPSGASAVVAVVAGDGNRRLFESLGVARIVEGGQTMNPSTAELVAAIEAAPAQEVVVFPNNGNVVLAAERAAEVSPKTAVVVPTTSIQAGLAAMVAFDPTRSAKENAAELRGILDSVRTGEVTIAVRDVELNGLEINKGAWLGLAEGQPVAGGTDFDEVASTVAELLLDETSGVLTLLTGQNEPAVDSLVKRIRARHPDLELEIHSGGQPHYPLLLSAE